PPDLLQELNLRDQLPTVAYEPLDETPFRRREPHLLAVADHALGREVDPEVVRVDRRLLVDGNGATQSRSEAGQELAHPERLGDVVVGAGVERGDLVRLGVPD